MTSPAAPLSLRHRLAALCLGLYALFGASLGTAAMNDIDEAGKVFADARTAALAAAVAQGDEQRVRELAAQGADPNARGDRGVTLLEWALLRQSPDGMRALLDAGANPSQPGLGGATVLHMAAMADDARYLRILLDYGADPNVPHGTTQAPPLSAALMNPSDQPFELLLAHRADPNRADRLGNTPLHVAAQTHRPALVLKLLQAGADPKRRNQHGDTFQTFFRIAPAGGFSAQARAQHAEVDAWLREHGAAAEAAR